MTTVVEIDARIQRAAKLVVAAVDHADRVFTPDARGRAATAVAIWEAFTGAKDSAAALDHARRVAAGEKVGSDEV
jgi:hypothetical protein